MKLPTPEKDLHQVGVALVAHDAHVTNAPASHGAEMICSAKRARLITTELLLLTRTHVLEMATETQRGQFYRF